jgi:EAL domain-containing protein (putative c-di-GMP-specific phosphodiesterase class I)/GGDEF domain-containing protein
MNESLLLTAFKKKLSMENSPVESVGNSEFEVRVRQAIRSGKSSFPQVAVLVLSFQTSIDALNLCDKEVVEFQSTISMRLKSALRDTDSVAVLKNGHLGVLLHSVQNPQDLDLISRRLLARLDDPVQVNDAPVALNPQIGGALFPENGDSVESLIEYAEVSLGTATANRHSQLPNESRARGVFSAREWMSELRHAIVTDQLFLTFQPKVDLSTGRVTGVEALTRWQHPEHGIILPDQFIPVAERTGLIIPLTLWVLQHSLIQCRQWSKMGLNMNVAVNLTMWNLEAQELPNQIEALLRDTGVSPKNLELEITETSIMTDPQRVIRTLNQIRQFGVQFTIDDFGTGYSSFAYLTKLPVSCIKIDKSFVQNIEVDRDSSVIVKSIIDLGHNLGLKVVAEGVETAAAKKILAAFNCDDGQGYYFSRPTRADATTKFLLRTPDVSDPASLVAQAAAEGSSLFG